MDLEQQLENQRKDVENFIPSKTEDSPVMAVDEPDNIAANNSFADGEEFSLREHTPMSYLLNNVPKHGQKGFKTFDIKLTCVAALPEYIALGSNVGIVYLYDRKEQKLLRLRSEGYIGPITCIQMCKSVDYMIAAGTKDGRIFCHKIPRMLHGKKWEALVIRGIHKESITCLEWSQNAEKIFSGDADGVVVCTIIQYGETICSSSQSLVQENYPIVQLSYSYRKLLIGSTFRSVIYNPSNSNGVQQIGQRSRKDLGKYGVTFFPLHSPTYDYMLYTARPNVHLWKCDSSGEVIETIILKDAIKDSISNIPLLQSSQHSSLQRENAGLGILRVYAEKYLISWNETSLVIIDPNRKTIVGSCWDLNNVIDLSICEDEIFVLQHDFRLIRLARQPEVIKTLPDTEEDKLLKAIVNPFKQLETSWKNLNIFEKDVSDKSENENHIFSRLIKSANSTNLISETPRTNDMQLALTPLQNTTPAPDVKPTTTEDSKVADNFEKNNFLLKQELNKTEFTSSDANKQLDNLKVDFSHIKIEETDEVVCTKTKRTKKKYKQGKAPKEVMSSSTSSLEQSLLFENEVKEKENIPLAHSHSEEILSKEDNSYDSKSDTLSSAVTENDSCKEIINETTVIEADSKTTAVNEEKSLTFTSLSNSGLAIPFETDMDSILNSILSRYEVKEDKTHEEVEMKTEEEADTSCVETDMAEHTKKTKLTKLKLETQFSNQSIQSPEYNVYARSTSVTDTETTGESKLSVMVNQNTLIDSRNSDEDDDSEMSDEMNIKILAYPDIWARDRFPGAILSLAVCNYFLCCVDNKNMVYYSKLSGGVSWRIVDKDVNEIAVSPTGKVMWILRKEIAYAGMVSMKNEMRGIVWMKVANDVQHIAVDKDYTWYIKLNGELHVQQNMFVNSSQNVSKKVSLEHPVSHVACSNGVVCILTNKGKLFCRTGITDYRPEGLSWQEISLGQRIAINLTIGANVLWIIDHLGNIWFQYGISEAVESKNQSHKWWQVDMSELLYEDSHRSLQRMNAVAASVLSPVVVLPTNLVFLNGGHKPCIGACDKGVWYCESLGRYLFSNRREIIGHRWRKVILKATSASFSWKYISASGMSFDSGVFWGMLTNDDFLCFSGLEHPPTFIHPPNTRNKICCIAAAQEALWVLTSVGEIYVRNGISPLHPEGTHWVKLNLTQLSNRLVHISCGVDVVWGCDCSGTVFLRVGSLKAPAGQSLHQAWVALDVNMSDSETHSQRFPQYGSSSQIHIVKVYTGQHHYMLWAIDKKNNIYVREGIFPELPIGTGWVYVKGIQAKELCIAGTYVWAVTLNNDVYCRYGITDKNYIGDYWKKFPGNVTSLSATSDCRLWAIGPDQVLYEHKMHVLHHQKESNNTTETSKKQEDGWELL